VRARIGRLVEQRTAANASWFGAEAARVARLCHAMAERFARGGRLLALGCSPAGRSDARHVAVEFVHPVIVGKRALPALAVTADHGSLPRRVELLAEPNDVVWACETEPGGVEIQHGVALAAARGCLTVSLAPSPAEWRFDPAGPDPFVRQELAETLYHVVWELVHVFFEHRGLLAGREVRTRTGGGAAAFLYPFLDESESDLEAVLDDVAASVRMKADEVGALRARTVVDGAGALIGAAGALRATFDRGGQVFALGNGGSATDAMDLVADLRTEAAGRPARRALDLTEDAGILTALANDLGTEAMFARQIIAWGRAGDAVVAFSTSGGSANVLAALAEARRRGMHTIAFVGYDGGRIAAEHLADHVVVTPSEHVPRIQEAQAAAYHVLIELLAG